MSALLVTKPETTGLRPIDLPRLRPVSNRTPIDVPQMAAPEAPARKARLSVVADQHEIAPDAVVYPGLQRLVGVLKASALVATSVALAFGLQLWLSM